MVIPKRPVADVLRYLGLKETPRVRPPRYQVDRYAGMIRVTRVRRRILPHNGAWEVVEAWLHEETPKGWRLASHWRPRMAAGKLKAPAPWAIGPADPPREDAHWPTLQELSA